MKIAIFTDCYLDLTGGIVTVIASQKAELERRGHTVELFTTGYPRDAKTLHRLARQNIFVVPSCRFLLRGLTPVSRRPDLIKKWLRETHAELKSFDIFYVHYEAGCSIAGLQLAKELGIPSVQVMHGREDVGESCLVPFGFRTLVATILHHLHIKFLLRSSPKPSYAPAQIPRDHYLATTLARAKMWELMVNHANYPDLVLAPSDHFRKKLQHYGVTNHLQVLPNGFSDANFVPRLKPRTFSGQRTPLRLIWHSRVSGEKRIMPFLKSLTMLAGPYHLDVFGDGEDLWRAKIYAKLHRLNVAFHGATKFAKLQPYLQKAHLDILVSYNYDTFGMTLIEAAAFGTPSLICDPDLKESVPEGCYLLAKGPSPAAVAAAINQIFTHPELIEQMSKTALTHRRELLMSRRMDQLEQIFRTVKKH